MINKKYLKNIIGIVISISILYYLFYTVNIDDVWANIKELPLYLYISLLGIYIINLMLRTYRWSIIIDLSDRVHLSSIFKAIIYGYLFNTLLPAKLGEIAKVEYLSQKYNDSRSFFLGTAVIDRIFDVLIIVLFFGLSVLYSDIVMSILVNSWAPIVFLLLGFLSSIIILININKFKRYIIYMPYVIKNKLEVYIDNIEDSSRVLSSLKKLFILVILSVFIWMLSCLSCFLILYSMGIQLPFYVYFFVVSAGVFGMIIPSTSANLGVYHGVATASLMLFMVTREDALSYAIIAHAFDTIPNLTFGLLIYYTKFTVKDFNNV